MSGLTFTVYGTPAPQGSKKGFVVGGRAVVVDDNKAPLRDWRNSVTHAALDALKAAQIDGVAYRSGPVRLAVNFYLRRPQAHYGRRGGQPYLKDNAPTYVCKAPDVDKQLRAVMDACTAAGVWRDDAQVALVRVAKLYAGRHAQLDRPGAVIHVDPMGGNA